MCVALHGSTVILHVFPHVFIKADPNHTFFGETKHQHLSRNVKMLNSVDLDWITLPADTMLMNLDIGIPVDLIRLHVFVQDPGFRLSNLAGGLLIIIFRGGSGKVRGTPSVPRSCEKLPGNERFRSHD